MTKKSPLQTFLDKYSTKGDVYNFTNMAAPFGKFNIPQDQLSKFVDVYIKTLKQGIVPVLTEKPGVAGPIVVDLDFKFSSESEERRYTLDTIVKVVAEYFNVIKQYIELNDQNSKCYVTERDQPYVETKKNGTSIVKDGIHMIFPFIRCFAAVKHLAREHVIATCGKLFLDLGITNGPEDVVDRAVIESNNWFVYCSAKPGRQAYRVTHVFDADMNELPFTDSWDFVKLFSVAGTEENVVFIKNPVCDIPESSARPARLAQPRIRSSAANQGEVPECVEEVKLELLQKIVMALAPFRAVSFDDWKVIVWSVNNISIDNKYTRLGTQLIHDRKKACWLLPLTWRLAGGAPPQQTYKHVALTISCAMYDAKTHRASKIKAYYAKKARDRKTSIVYDANPDDPMTRVIDSLSSRVNAELQRRSLKRTDTHMQIIGCNRAFLKKQLESQFVPEMSWDNYGAWQVDHIIGICNWDLSDHEQFMRCFNYKNLQPLWLKDNLEKAKYID